jgi:hypothetical protein
MRSNPFKFFITALLIGAGLACGGADGQREAGRLVGEAQKLLEKTDVLIKKTEARNRKLFDADVQTAEELAAYRIKMKPEAASIVENYMKASEQLRRIAEIFDRAAALDVAETYQNYARTKADEFYRRAEAFEARRGNAQIFIESGSPNGMTGKFDENNSLFEKLLREAEDLNAAAKNIENENRDFFAEFK